MLPEALLVLDMGKELSSEMVLGSDSDPRFTNSRTGTTIASSAQCYHGKDWKGDASRDGLGTVIFIHRRRPHTHTYRPMRVY